MLLLTSLRPTCGRAVSGGGHANGRRDAFARRVSAMRSVGSACDVTRAGRHVVSLIESRIHLTYHMDRGKSHALSAPGVALRWPRRAPVKEQRIAVNERSTIRDNLPEPQRRALEESTAQPTVDNASMLLLAALVQATLPPVVIVPGDGSNQLEARLDKPAVPHFYCAKTSDWYRIWLNTADLLAKTSCWADNIRLSVNATTGRSTNAPGVETRVPYWGSTEAFEELDPAVPFHATAAFRQLVDAFVAAGYERNVTLRGAPYDFRHTPDSSDFPSRLRTLIEETVEAAGGQRATLVSHSMGGLQTLYFLQSMTAPWKAQHIAQWIPISTPLAGAAKVARLFASGDNEGLPISPAAVRDEQRSYETNHWLLPSAGVDSPWAGFTLVRTETANYTVDDMNDFFSAVGYSVGALVQPRVAALLPSRGTGPGVPVLCLYSSGIETPLSFYYPGADFGRSPVITNGDGDGTVNSRSLRLCERWQGTQREAVRVQTFASVTHSGMLSDERVIGVVLNATVAGGESKNT